MRPPWGRRWIAASVCGAALGAMLARAVPAATAPASTGTVASRAQRARGELADASGHRLDGRGASIAIIDTGIDPTHPAFALAGRGSKVAAVLSAEACIIDGEESPYTSEVSSDPACVVPVPPANVDAGHGGHGTMVGGVAVGDAYQLPDGTEVGGVALGARLIVISTTAGLVGIDNAFAWILAHHAAPCGAGVPASECPPIKVVNCSWGASTPAIAHLQDALARAGVVTVWANGNTGGDGSTDHSNPDATDDQTPGVIAVAAYDDHGTGTRDGELASTSSRGQASQPTTWPDVSAPGVNIISACRPYQAICPAVETEPPRSGPGPNDVDTYFIGSGTSFAAPEVAGIVAMLFQADPAASAGQIEDALKSTAYKFKFGVPYQALGPYTSSYDKGAGLVDAYAASLALGARRLGGDPGAGR